ncbi:hypothetical protein MIND_00998100 [Mycena indigotica]|uniref:Uncharacterized protein n=1 Tax=Mycena indigotica TaxID=2126181 RepID=A0A8H6S9E5_9AGAR|nr:uncharacterized protein MIND_00998100 [Mycena indigotica]KAF7294615.1 hypothetical protein MIND_00998100 [Mycena indigotica]
MNKDQQRKIRFAPLPDPRRDEPVDIAEESEDMPPPPSPLPNRPASPAFCPARPSSPSPSASPSWGKPKSLLRALRKGNAVGLTSSRSLDSAPDASWGASLQRWSSGSSLGSPLARTQSQTSNASSTKRTRSLFSIGNGNDKGKATPRNPFANSLATKRGTRMLNGRVYGSRNADGTHNPFGNARDEEPEFVEWGYGGMGSVRNGAGNSAWNRVQAGGAPRTSGTAANSGDVHIGMGVVGDGDEDGDDGSGMGWVRKRREAREREAKERAEREAKEAEENTPEESTTPTATDSTPALDSASSTTLDEEQHVLRAVTLPAGFRGHHHHHRSSSNPLGSGSPAADDNAVSAKPSHHTSSDSDSDSDSGDDDDDVKDNPAESDTESDLEEEIEQRRATALSAGVEKISRHKE